MVGILAQKQINLYDPYSDFVIGDLGAQALFYYVALEHQWVLRHQIHVPAERREVSWSNYGVQVNFQFYSQDLSNLQSWEATLKKLLVQLKHPNFVTDLLSASTQRLSIFSSQNYFRVSLYLSGR